jgi:hypothetical protein
MSGLIHPVNYYWAACFLSKGYFMAPLDLVRLIPLIDRTSGKPVGTEAYDFKAPSTALLKKPCAGSLKSPIPYVSY